MRMGQNDTICNNCEKLFIKEYPHMNETNLVKYGICDKCKENTEETIKKTLSKIHFVISEMLSKLNLSNAAHRLWFKHEKETYQIASGMLTPLPCVDIEEIKQNGLKLDSPLLWALLDNFNYISLYGNTTEWYALEIEPLIKPLNFINDPYFGILQNMYIGIDGNIYYAHLIPFDLSPYFGDWKDSLTKRPEGM